ncbi:MAG: hypothetical protein IKC09_10805 [Oscillospiraceae bacterium]|nr:hypothetical protein [Oscillospiraceae bacterium]
MKKLISLILALALVMSMSAVVFAEDQTNVNVGDYTADVTGTYVEGTTGGTIFSVDIAWAGMSFTYHAEQQPVWDVETHTYSEAVAAYWEGEGTITVTNHSNAKISATPTYTKNTGFESANMSFSTAKLLVASAESGSAQTGTITVTPSGSLPANTEDTTIGTITIAIAHNPDYTKAEMQALLDKVLALHNELDDTSMSPELEVAEETMYTDYVAHITDMQSGYYDDPTKQEQLNRDYTELLSFYNKVKALMNV